MAMIDAASMAAKWAKNTAGAQQAYTDGINRVTENPMAKAASRQDAWAAGVQAAASSGKFAARLNATPMSAWKDGAIKKGAARLASGVQAALPKMQAVAGPLLAHIASGLSSLPPRGPAGSNDGRMLQWSAYMRSFRRS